MPSTRKMDVECLFYGDNVHVDRKYVIFLVVFYVKNMYLLFFQETDYLFSDNLERGIANSDESAKDRLDRVYMVYRRCSYHFAEFVVQVLISIVKLVLGFVQVVKRAISELFQPAREGRLRNSPRTRVSPAKPEVPKVGHRYFCVYT